jgi:hypothetical protein
MNGKLFHAIKKVNGLQSKIECRTLAGKPLSDLVDSLRDAKQELHYIMVEQGYTVTKGELNR